MPAELLLEGGSAQPDKKEPPEISVLEGKTCCSPAVCAGARCLQFIAVAHDSKDFLLKGLSCTEGPHAIERKGIKGLSGLRKGILTLI